MSKGPEIEISVEDRVKRRVAEGEARIAEAEIERLEAEIARLETRKSKQQSILARARLTAQGIDPCELCQRHVAAPCHSKAYMQESGPWDGFCREFAENRP